MRTTELFVELIVIGIGAFCWIVLTTVGIFGYMWIPIDQLVSIFALIPFLSFVYITGIITDRIADVIFSKLWVHKILRKYYSSPGTEIEDRRFIYSKNEYMANLMEYGRSRLRISRGWAFNSFITIIAFNFFIFSQITEGTLQIQLLVWGNFLIGFITIFSWYSWYQLTDAQYRRSKGEANFLRREMGIRTSRKK
ncbi:MAG: hypothetical protein KF758_09880 [Anaerolineales bacterium]|nr:hypothetical protein [Anaerolineales bacterium]